jgi:hypothetical protein
MNFSRIGPSAKISAALLIFVAGCLLSSARILREAPRHNHLSQDDVAQRSDQRFAAIKAALPPRGLIGYIGESGDSTLPDYYLAQYALAPLILDRGVEHRLIVGNFPNATPVIPLGISVEKDFGNGTFLLTNKDSAR